MIDIDALTYNSDGLLPVVTQDATSGAVVMVAWANREALQATVDTGEMHYWSRKRGLWHKGATSGNTQAVVSLHADCDADVVLARVRCAGPACHTGTTSCFGDGLESDVLSAVDAVVAARSRASSTPSATPSYTQQLLADRNLRLKKLGEEASELVLACADEDPPRATEEAADLVYHALVALRALGVGLDDVRQVLAERAGGGHTREHFGTP